jgi:hypothetical protein
MNFPRSSVALLVIVLAAGCAEGAPPKAMSLGLGVGHPSLMQAISAHSEDLTWQPLLQPLRANPQAVYISLDDGQQLAGVYYPAKVNPAPVVVLMHWAGGNMRDWAAIAPWLQNRAADWPTLASLADRAASSEEPWRNPDWFPAIHPDASFGVLVFDYECFGLSDCTVRDHVWLEDSLSAVKFASTLEGVDPNAIMTVGASIGADGALDSCYLFNEAVVAGEAQGNCAGAFSISPGNHLTSGFTYMEGVSALTATDSTVFCLAAQEEGSTRRLCSKPSADTFHPYFYPGRAHGMVLIAPTATASDEVMGPNPLQLLLEFLSVSTGSPVAAEP